MLVDGPLFGWPVWHRHQGHAQTVWRHMLKARAGGDFETADSGELGREDCDHGLVALATYLVLCYDFQYFFGGRDLLFFGAKKCSASKPLQVILRTALCVWREFHKFIY